MVLLNKGAGMFMLVACLLLHGTASAEPLRAQVITTGLVFPWSLAFLPDGQMLVTERPGRLRIVQADGRLSAPVAGLPEVVARGQGGLLDVIVDSDFIHNRTLFFCFAQAAESGTGNSTALARARLSPGGDRLDDVKLIFSQQPRVASSAHFGCRIVEGRRSGVPDGTLFLTLGERFGRMADAQKLDNHLGKVVRIDKSGGIPKDNPYADGSRGLPEIWSVGHRNPQGAALAPDGRLWVHEHGPQGGDEINLPEPGRNYGWPVITHGENYGGGRIGEGIRRKDGMGQPIHFWVPSIAPSGMAFLTSDRYGPDWRGNVFIGALVGRHLVRIEWRADGRSVRVVRESRLLTELGERIRDVRQGPDGLLYVLTDAAEGRLIRLLPPQ